MQKCSGHSLSHLTLYKLGYQIVLFIMKFRLENVASPVMPIFMFGYHLAAEEMSLLIVDASCVSFSWYMCL